MDKQQKNSSGQGPAEGTGYQTPGQDRIIQSSSPAVPSPGKPSEDRLTTPKSRIDAIGETPGDSNPALEETAGFEQGTGSTADLLRARETAEEEGVKARGIHPYQDQGPGASPDEYERSDTGRPVWPNDRQEQPIEYMESPRADSSYMAGSTDKIPDIKGRTDMTMERGSTQAAAHTTKSGLPPTGFDSEEDIYEREEMHTPTEPSDLDRIAPGMINVPSEESDEQR